MIVIVVDVQWLPKEMLSTFAEVKEDAAPDCLPET